MAVIPAHASHRLLWKSGPSSPQANGQRFYLPMNRGPGESYPGGKRLRSLDRTRKAKRATPNVVFVFLVLTVVACLCVRASCVRCVFIVTSASTRCFSPKNKCNARTARNKLRPASRCDRSPYTASFVCAALCSVPRMSASHESYHVRASGSVQQLW